jgi:hypothetical protein
MPSRARDIHTIYNDLKIREQLKQANGRADNQVIWLFPNPQLAASDQQAGPGRCL